MNLLIILYSYCHDYLCLHSYASVGRALEAYGSHCVCLYVFCTCFSAMAKNCNACKCDATISANFRINALLCSYGVTLTPIVSILKSSEDQTANS